MMHTTASVNQSSIQSLLYNGMSQLNNLAWGTLRGLSTGVRSVCHLPVSLWNGVRSRYEQHGMTQVAFDVGHFTLGGAVLVKMNQLLTEMESSSYLQLARTLALAWLTIWAYKHSNKMTSQFKEIKDNSLGQTSISFDQSMNRSFGFNSGPYTPAGQSMVPPSQMNTGQWWDAIHDSRFAQFMDGSEYRDGLQSLFLPTQHTPYTPATPVRIYDASGHNGSLFEQ